MADYLVSMQGEIADNEIFVHTLAAESSLGAQAVANLARDTWAARWLAGGTNLSALFSDEITYTQASAAEILDLSTGALAAASHAQFVADEIGGTGNSGPFQVACKISLVAGVRPNGTPLRGGFYLPTIGSTAVIDGRFTSFAIAALVQLIEDWFTDLEAGGVVPSVWSRTLATVQAVTAGNIGDVPDTIRSRRNGLVESRTPIVVS